MTKNPFLSAHQRAAGLRGDLKRHKFQHARNVIRDGGRPTKVAHQQWCEQRRASYKKHRDLRLFNNRKLTVNNLISGELYLEYVRVGHCDLIPYLSSLGAILSKGAILWILRSVRGYASSDDLVTDPYAVGGLIPRSRLLIEAILILMHDMRSKPDRLTCGRVMPYGGSRREVDRWYYLRFRELASWIVGNFRVAHGMRTAVLAVCDDRVSAFYKPWGWWVMLNTSHPSLRVTARDGLNLLHGPTGYTNPYQGLPERMVDILFADHIATLYPYRIYLSTKHREVAMPPMILRSITSLELWELVSHTGFTDYLDQLSSYI